MVSEGLKILNGKFWKTPRKAVSGAELWEPL